MPIFQLSVLFSLIGFIFGYFLEKFNFSRMYKKPEMLNNKKISEFYSNYFILNFFMLCIGNYIFLKDTYKSNIWPIFNLIFFGILIIIPYNQILIFDFIGINESEIKKNQNYEDYYFSFYNDYERNNPMTKKQGIKHFLKKLIENALISKKDYELILKNVDNVNLLETYYKARINFSHNLLQKAFLGLGDTNKTNNKNRRKSRFISNFKEFAKNNKINALTRLILPHNLFGNIINENDDNNFGINDIMGSNENNVNNNNMYDEDYHNNNLNLNLNMNFNKNFKKRNDSKIFNDLKDSQNQILVLNKSKSNNSSEKSVDSKLGNLYNCNSILDKKEKNI